MSQDNVNVLFSDRHTNRAVAETFNMSYKTMVLPS